MHITTFCTLIQVRFDAARLRANDMIIGLGKGWIEKITLERYMKQKRRTVDERRHAKILASDN